MRKSFDEKQLKRRCEEDTQSTVMKDVERTGRDQKRQADLAATPTTWLQLLVMYRWIL